MKPVIEKSQGSNHFDVYYPIEHSDLLSSDGIVSAVNDLREAWSHFLGLRKEYQKQRLPYYFWYYFRDGNNLHKPSTFKKDPESVYDNLNKFWMNAASQSDLRSLYELYLDDLLAHFNDESIKDSYKSLWHSDTIQLGSVVTFQLAMADQSYISLYANLFQYWDMEHETYQFKEVQTITEKYGVTDETLDLIRKRCSSQGQHNHSQFLNFLKIAKFNLEDLESSPKLVKLIREFGTLDWDSYDLKFEDPNWDWTSGVFDNQPILDEALRAEVLDILNYKSIFVRLARLVKARCNGIFNTRAV